VWGGSEYEYEFEDEDEKILDQKILDRIPLCPARKSCFLARISLSLITKHFSRCNFGCGHAAL
jgi:hypothetical protein